MTGPDDVDDARDPAPDPSLDAALDDADFDDADFEDPGFEELRALLADARVSEPVPVPVVARLDDTLASLQAERQRTARADAVVVPLRRRFAPILVAAAAVVVVAAGGLGISRLAHDGSGSSNTSADSAAGSASSLASTPPPDSGAKSAAPSGGVPAPQAPAIAGQEALALPTIRSTEFAQDAAQVMRTLAADTTTQGQLDSSPGTQDTNGSLQAPPVTASPRRSSAYDTRALAACDGPSIADTVVVPARLDGSLVALVFRAPTVGAQQVEAWSCDGTTLLTSASVPR